MLSPQQEREGRPGEDRAAVVISGESDAVNVPEGSDMLADVDAMAENLSGRLVVQVVVDATAGHRRTHVYRSAAAAERCVQRAVDRGQVAHVTLVRMLPVGVVVGLGGR